MVLTPEMARRGITPQLLRTTKQITCPKCGKSFSLFQSRAIACVGCPKSGTSCDYARCIHCDTEFPLISESKWVANKVGERNLSTYMNNIVNNYNTSVGKTKHR
jgi:hypothetical protein